MEVAFSYLGCYGNMQQRRCLAEHQELQWNGLRFEISGRCRCQTGEPSNIASFIFLEKASLKRGRYINNGKQVRTDTSSRNLQFPENKSGGLSFSLVLGLFFGAGSHVKTSRSLELMIIFPQDFPPDPVRFRCIHIPRYVHCDANSMVVGLHDRELRKNSMMFGLEKSPQKSIKNRVFFVRALSILTLQNTHGSKKPLRKKHRLKNTFHWRVQNILRVDIFFRKKGPCQKYMIVFFFGIDDRQSETNI